MFKSPARDSLPPAAQGAVVLAVGPEAGIDKAGYDRAVRAAKQRLDRLKKSKEKK